MTFTIKILLAMKMTALILFIAIMQVSAGSYAQKITLSQKNAKLQHVFKEIWKQSGYDFVYDKVLLQKAKPVTFSVKDATLEEALTACFNGQPFTYSIDNKIIVVKQKETSLIQKITNLFSAIDVRGKVVDENGEPLQGATVKVKGSTVGTMTDKDGEFFLKGVPEDGVIVIAYLGYKPLELKGNASIGTIKMELETSKLDEVKISGGYYETTDRLKTGSIVKVTAKDIERQPVTSLLMALQGRVPGLEITPQSGAAGVAPTIRIRGNNSLRQDNSLYGNGNYPLYVIDGAPVSSQPIKSWTSSFSAQGYDPLSTIDPANIESIEVLKDGDATAIYGSRGANGVILITTKKGYLKNQPTTLNVNIYNGVGQVPKKLNLMGTQEYLDMRKEAIIKDGAASGVYGMYAYDLIYWDTTRYTDWQKLLVGGTSNIFNVRSNLSWGTRNTSFQFSSGYHKETMVTPGDFGYHRISSQLALNHRSEDEKFLISLSSTFGLDKNHLFADGGKMMRNAITLAPNSPKPFNDDGSLNWEVRKVGSSLISTWENPFALLKIKQDAINQNSINNLNISYQLLDGLSFRTGAAYTNYAGSEYITAPISAASPDVINPQGGASKVETKRVTWTIEPSLSFTKTTTAGHGVNFIAGLTFQEQNMISSTIQGEGYVSDALLGSLIGASNFWIVQDLSQQYKYNSIYARIGYNWRDKYLLNLTGRRDGSSRFGPGNRFGNFGSIGTAWIFSEEKSIKTLLPFMTFGKIRSSYGVTGSDNIGDYNYLNLYSILTEKYGSSTGTFPTALYNPEFAWESTRKFDVALEMAFFRDRISFELNWYRNRSSNQLVETPLPLMTGFASVLSNFDATVENSGWELILRGDVLKTSSLKWNMSLNFSMPKNRLIKFDGIEESPYKNMYSVGEPLSIQWLYTYMGVNRQTGLYEVEDKNKDGIYNDLDRTLVNLIGNPFSGGINNSILYKNLSVSFLLQYSHQNAPRFLLASAGRRGTNQISGAFENRWRNQGELTDVQRFSNDEGYVNYVRARSSDFNSMDASFVRLKTVSINYSLPQPWLKKSGVKELQLFLQGQNIFTLTKYEALDPETRMGLPPLRMITAGVQFKF